MEQIKPLPKVGDWIDCGNILPHKVVEVCSGGICVLGNDGARQRKMSLCSIAGWQNIEAKIVPAPNWREPDAYDFERVKALSDQLLLYKSALDVAQDKIAELEGIPQCSFCRKRSTGICSNRSCEAPICNEHGTIVGSFHVSMADQKQSFGGSHVECSRCHGITTSKLTLESTRNA